MDRTFDILIENGEAFIKVFPEIKQRIENIKTVKESEGCTNCKKRAYAQDVVNIIMTIPKEGRDTDSLAKLCNPSLMAALNYDPIQDNPKPLTRQQLNIKSVTPVDEAREGCPDCVCKHLSQALIIMDEIVQGYPEHVMLALQHTRRALKYSTGKNVKTHKKLREIEKNLEEIHNFDKEDHDVYFHLFKAKNLVEEILDSSTSHPLSVWRVIGHMGEAADECVEHNPELASQIRMERLAMMEDHHYRPPLGMLLQKAKKDRNE